MTNQLCKTQLKYAALLFTHTHTQYTNTSLFLKCSCFCLFVNMAITSQIENDVTCCATIVRLCTNKMAAPWFRIYPSEPEEELGQLLANPGTKNMPPRNSPPIVYFCLMFSLNILRKIVKETNFTVSSKQSVFHIKWTLPYSCVFRNWIWSSSINKINRIQ